MAQIPENENNRVDREANLGGSAEDSVSEAEKLCSKGAQLLRDGSWNEALSVYDEAVRAAPDNPVCWHGRGTALLKLGRSEEALAAYDRATDLDPKMGPAWRDKAVVLSNLGRREEGLKAFDRSIDILTRDAVQEWTKGMFVGRYFSDRKGKNDKDKEPRPRRPWEKKPKT